MKYANTTLWFAGLLLEGVLLSILFRRKLSGRLPLFVALLAFYVLRGTGLFIASSRTSREFYVDLSSALALIDIALQLALAAFLWLRLSDPTGPHAAGQGRSLRLFALPFGLLVACALTVLFAHATPVHSPLHIDRGVTTCAFFFLTLLAFSRKAIQAGIERLLFQGFGGLGVINIASQYGRSIAAAHNNPRLFLFWVYCAAVAWLLLLVIWIVQLRRRSISDPGLPLLVSTAFGDPRNESQAIFCSCEE